MKVQVVSDIHLEIGHIPHLPGGDILILAGDTLVLAHTESKRQDPKSVEHRRNYETFFRVQVSKYQRVLVLMGNHEHYGGVIEDSYDLYTRFLEEHAPHAKLLENETAKIGDWTFLGTSLWAPCQRKSEPWVEHHIADSMNDFRMIRTRSVEERSDWGDSAKMTMTLINGRPLKTSDVRKLHESAVRFLRDSVRKQDRVVVLTHHAPSLKSGTKYQLTGSINGDVLTPAYCSSQDHWIEKSPQIAVWVHGHTHVSVDYQIGQTRVLANQHGYWGHEAIARHFNASNGEFALEVGHAETDHVPRL